MNNNTTTATTTTTATINNDATAQTDMVRIQTAVNKLNASADKDDLDAFIRGGRRSVLLVDVSFSMNDGIRSGGRKIDALRKVVNTLRETHAVPVAAFGVTTHESGVELVNDVPEPQGSTPMNKAIDFGRVQGANHLVIVTDGQPNDESTTMTAARRFANPIDVFYVGDGPGRAFAQRLAAATGGTFHNSDLGAIKSLASGIRLMLGDGTN
jgi:hypothetical protein